VDTRASCSRSRIPAQAGLIWVGTNDGLIQLTENGGTKLDQPDRERRRPVEWGTISNIEPSRYDVNTAYVTVERPPGEQPGSVGLSHHRSGRSWKLITAGIPHNPLSYAHWIKEDPGPEGSPLPRLENSVWVSFTDGDGWQPLQSNLPNAPAYGLTVQEHYNDLVSRRTAAASGARRRHPLQQLTPAIAAKTRIFSPRATYRLRASKRRWQ